MVIQTLGMAEGLHRSSCTLRGFLPEEIALAESGCGGAKSSCEKDIIKLWWGHHAAKRGQDVERQCNLLAKALASRSMKGCWTRRDIEMGLK